MSLLGTYAGLVEDNKDPEKLGRLKVRVPHVYGAVGGVFGAISTENLPWSMPSGLPNGLSQNSGGFDWLPEVGDQVLVRFLDGEPEKPVYEWFMQTQKAAETFKLHQYKDATGAIPGSGGGKPKRGAMVRYGHTVEWNADGLILTTSKGYRLLLTDASRAGNDGDIQLASAMGQYLEFDDLLNQCNLNVNLDWQINVGNQIYSLSDSVSINTMSNEIEMVSGSYMSIDTLDNLEAIVGGDWRMDVTGDTYWTMVGDVTIDVTGSWIMTVVTDLDLSVLGNAFATITGNLELTSIGTTTLDFSSLFLGTGSTESFVLGNQLLTYLTQLVSLLQAHQHPEPDGTTSPTATVFPTPTAALLSQVIKGR
jgi:hypothetical protein